MPFNTINKGAAANDGSGTPARSGADIINALINAANAGALQGFKNGFINGALQVWQRGTSFASGASQFTADRFKFRRGSVAAGATVSRQSGTWAAASYCARVQRDNGNAGAEAIYFGQQIASINCTRYQGKTVVITAFIRAGANFSGAGATLGCLVHTGTGSDETVNEITGFATGVVTTALTAQAINTTGGRIYFPGHVVPSNATELAAFLNYTPSGTAGAADYFEITGFQIEIVNATDKAETPFEQVPVEVDLDRCERYCEKSFLAATTPAQNVGVNTGEHVFPALQAGATAQRSQRVRFRQRKHAAPVLTLYNPAAANAQARDKTAAADCSATATANITEDGFEITATGAAGGAISNPLGIHWLAVSEI